MNRDYQVQHRGFLRDVVDDAEGRQDDQGDECDFQEGLEGAHILQREEADHEDEVGRNDFPEQDGDELRDASPVMRTVRVVVQEGDGKDNQRQDQLLDPEGLDHLLEAKAFREDVEDRQEKDRVAHRQRKGHLRQYSITEDEDSRLVLTLEGQHEQAADNQDRFEEGGYHRRNNERMVRSFFTNRTYRRVYAPVRTVMAARRYHGWSISRYSMTDTAARGR